MKNLLSLPVTILAVGGLALAAEQKSESKAAEKPDTAAADQHKIVSPIDVVWADAPPSLPPGAKMAVLYGDPNKKGSFTIRLLSPDGYKVPPHTHPSAERITVLSGRFISGWETNLIRRPQPRLGQEGSLYCRLV